MKKIVSKFIFLVAVFIFGYLIFSIFANYTIYRYKINGEKYNEIIDGNVLIADVYRLPHILLKHI